MEIAFLDRSIKITQVEDLEQLCTYFSNLGVEWVLLDEDPSLAKRHFTILLTQSGSPLFGIGIGTEIEVIPPQILLVPETALWMIGVDDRVVIFDVIRHKVVRYITLPSIFYHFIDLPNYRIVIVRDETGIVAVDYEGEELWRYEPSDIIVLCAVEEQHIMIEMFEGETVKLRLTDGHLEDSGRKKT